MHAELDEKQASLRRASELKIRVVANVSHEFRAPLSSIVGLSRLLLDHSDGDLSPEQERQVGFIQRSAELLTELVDDLLDLSHLESGRVGLRLRRCTPEEIFAPLRGMLRPLVREGTDLVFEDHTAGVELETDEGKISQILRNLITNALKFTEQGEVRVAAEIAGDSVRLSVADTGIGIAPADQARIFDEFVQIDSPLQRRVKGTGLGLSLSSKLAERIGGHVEVESAPGRGSTFTLTFPRVHPEAREQAGLVDLGARLHPARVPAIVLENLSRSGKAAKVLVIDDDEVSRYLVRSLFRDTPHLVVEADSGPGGVEVARRERPDVIFLDFVLRDVTGFEVLDALERDPLTRSIPVVVHTSKELSASEHERLAVRVTAVISKQSLSREVAIARVREARVNAGRRPGPRSQGR
ncbi:MAG: hybrid sensor histidine kinase/response regulator [Minicystis sp.]